MTFAEKKSMILAQLNQETSPISLSDLMNKLGTKYKERTVRRWLAEMVNEGSVEKQGHRKAAKYQATKQTDTYQEKALTITSNFKFGSESFGIIQQIRRPIYERVGTTYADDWFDAYQPNKTFYIPLDSRLELYKAGKRSKNHDPAGTYAHQILNRLLIDLSYNSSRLEGNTYSLIDTERLVLQGTIAEGKLEEEKIMILNHKEAIRYIVDNAPRLTIDKQTILTLHYLLADGLLETEFAGKVRNHSLRIGGSTYVPFEDRRRLQLQLEQITEKASLISDPYEQSLFLLIHVSYLQAFSDVNKRTARLSANIPFIKDNLIPLSFNDVERADYSSAMIAIYELQDVRPLIDLYMFSYLRTCKQYDSTIESMGYDEVRVRYRQQRRNLLRDIIVSGFIGKKMKEYAALQAKIVVKKEDQAAFLKDTFEDLKAMDEVRMVGLGISEDQLNGWLKKNLNSDF